MHTYNSGTRIIQATHITKKYKITAGEYEAAKDINLSINKGEFVAIVGKSGSGKSTLLNIISGIDRPSSGEIIVKNKLLNTMTEGEISRWRGRNVGIVFQFFQLLPTLSVIENVMLPMDFCNSYPISNRKNRAKEVLEKVGVCEHANKLPSALSGGEQQRVAIARALANNPDIIVADEPTGNLDSNTSKEIFRLFECLINDGKTIIMVTHNNELAHCAQRIITIQDGKVVSDSNKAAVNYEAY